VRFSVQSPSEHLKNIRDRSNIMTLRGGGSLLKQSQCRHFMGGGGLAKSLYNFYSG